MQRVEQEYSGELRGLEYRAGSAFKLDNPSL